MRSPAVAGFAAALALVAFCMFVGVAITEINYVDDHRYRYGPAKVIAWGAGGGAVLALAVGSLALAVLRTNR